jgi:hypothetical protein
VKPGEQVPMMRDLIIDAASQRKVSGVRHGPAGAAVATAPSRGKGDSVRAHTPASRSAAPPQHPTTTHTSATRSSLSASVSRVPLRGLLIAPAICSAHAPHETPARRHRPPPCLRRRGVSSPRGMLPLRRTPPRSKRLGPFHPRDEGGPLPWRHGGDSLSLVEAGVCSPPTHSLFPPPTP